MPLISGAKLFLIVFAVCAFLYSCKNESDVIGLDVQPLNDIIGADFTDTTTLITKTLRVDSLRTDENLFLGGEAILGTYNDPVFGKTAASLYTQVRLKTLNPSFGTGVIVDSVVLSLVYNPSAKHYGKTQRAPQRVNVYQITEDMATSNAYYSHHKLDTSNIDLANNYTFSPKPKDSVYVFGKGYKPQLRIPLDANFGNTLITEATSNPSSYATVEAFQTYMKGLYITTQNSVLNTGDGNIFNFLCADDLSKLTIYYHNDGGDSLTFDYALGSVARFSHLTHDYTPTSINSNLAAQLGTTPPAQNDVVFVQPMAGLKTKIEMPYLKNLLNQGKIAINKAELVLKIDTNPIYELDTFAVPDRLVLLGINDDGTMYALPDANEGDSYLGGGYNATTKEYKFNIARYVQQVMLGQKNNNGLYLQVRDGSVVILAGTIVANRLVLGGGGTGAGTNKMKLNISYTKLQ